jgi:alginate O-acetyltransferase complex protein AlgJ
VLAVSVSQTDRVDVGGAQPARHRRRRRQFSPVVLVLALVFFFTPAVALAAGFRAHQIENRPLAKFPSIHDGWKALPELGTWATDHLFGRKQAVALNDQIAQHVFRQLPDNTGGTKPGGYPAVIQGKGGWLFLGDDVKTRCTTRSLPATVVAKLNRLSDLIRKSGRTFVLMIAPDKSSVYPQYLPKSYLGRDCAPAYTTAFWKAFDQHIPPGYVDVRTPLIQQAKTSPVPLYRPLDSHWDMEGISIEAQLMAKALDPALARGTHVEDRGTYTPIGDLTYLLGQPRKDTLPARPLVRDGVTMTPGSDLSLHYYRVSQIHNTSTDAPLYQPKTLILGDSFTDTSKQYIAPYFADLTMIHNQSSGLQMADAMIGRSTVIFQVAERVATTGYSVLLTDKALDTVARVLAANPAPK